MRKARVFVDASVLIFLSKAELLHLLRKLYGRVYLSTEVEAEVLSGTGPSRELVAEALGRWILRVPTGRPTEELAAEARARGMGVGEYSLTLVQRRGDTIILANGRAERKLREELGMTVKDIIDVGTEASRRRLVSFRRFVRAIYAKGYRTRRLMGLLGA